MRYEKPITNRLAIAIGMYENNELEERQFVEECKDILRDVSRLEDRYNAVVP